MNKRSHCRNRHLHAWFQIVEHESFFRRYVKLFHGLQGRPWGGFTLPFTEFPSIDSLGHDISSPSICVSVHMPRVLVCGTVRTRLLRALSGTCRTSSVVFSNVFAL